MKDFLIIFFLLLPPCLNAQFHTTGKDLPCVNKNFKVVAHVGVNQNGETEITEAEIRESVEAVNQYFEPICVSFTVCKIDTMSNYNFNYPQEHLYEEMHATFGEEHLIDIYYCFMQVGGPQICGRTVGNILDELEGAVYLNKSCTEVLVHEFGHLFGLRDTYTASTFDELADNSNCETTGDLICDTPADPYDGGILSLYIDDCEFVFQGQDPNGDFYLTEVGNIMSAYVPCYCGFSRQQYLKMVETFNASPNRFW